MAFLKILQTDMYSTALLRQLHRLHFRHYSLDITKQCPEYRISFIIEDQDIHNFTLTGIKPRSVKPLRHPTFFTSLPRSTDTSSPVVILTSDYHSGEDLEESDPNA